METQVLEGTFAEVQQRLSELPLEPDARLRIIVTESFESSIPFLLPATGPITTELVKELLYQSDMEDALGENWEEKLAQLRPARVFESSPPKGEK